MIKFLTTAGGILLLWLIATESARLGFYLANLPSDLAIFGAGAIFVALIAVVTRGVLWAIDRHFPRS